MPTYYSGFYLWYYLGLSAPGWPTTLAEWEAEEKDKKKGTSDRDRSRSRSKKTTTTTAAPQRPRPRPPRKPPPKGSVVHAWDTNTTNTVTGSVLGKGKRVPSQKLSPARP